MDLPIDRDTELIYVGGLPIETNNDDIGLIFSDVPIVRVFKLWKTDVNLISALILVHKNHVSLIVAYDKKKVFINNPPIMVLPVNTFQTELKKQMHNSTERNSSRPANK